MTNKNPNLDGMALYEAMREKLRALYRRDQDEIHDRVLAFHDGLKVRYPDFRDYQLFHLVSGSTLRDSHPKMDFPSPDSVEEFVNAEWAKAFGHESR